MRVCASERLIPGSGVELAAVLGGRREGEEEAHEVQPAAEMRLDLGDGLDQRVDQRLPSAA